jgi:UDP-N-acetyl-D-mannosaminuronic acid transferase (WecB/TagA/CpsF family)
LQVDAGVCCELSSPQLLILDRVASMQDNPALRSTEALLRMGNPQPAIDNTHRTILGISFFGGQASEAIAAIRTGGLLVSPAAPALKNMDCDAGYRNALLGADIVITDSALMVMAWNFLQHDSLHRLSGLNYLRELVLQPDVRQSGNTLWVMASPSSAATNVQWLAKNGIVVDPEHIYIAPIYAAQIADPPLLALLDRLRPQHIITTLGGGTQERLGLYLKQNLAYLPAIHCIGAAIAFLSGDQADIPVWGDRFYLGWLFRCIYNPKRFIPRYWGARKLIALLLRYRDRLPDLRDC